MRFFVFGLMLLLAACATSYEGGVTARPIGEDVYRIEARGNDMTSPSTVEDFVFLKAAETALANGHTHFTVQSLSDRSTQYSASYNMGYGNSVSVPALMPGVDVMVRIHSNPLQDGAVDAQSIVETVGPRLQ